MFSKNIVHLIILDIKNYIYHKVQQIKENFWPSSFIKITYKNTAVYCKLFLFDYFSFKEMFLQMLKKIFNTFLFLLFLFLLINFLDQQNIVVEKLYFYFIILFLIFYLSLKHVSWLAYLLASINYLLLIRFFYLTFSFKVAFCLWFLSFFFVREFLNYIFNYLLFKLKSFYKN